MYYMLYCTAHWAFSMKYWIISYKLGQGKMLDLMNLIYYLVMALNIIIPIYAEIEQAVISEHWRVSY